MWQNECGGSRDGLTSWNAGEDFGSFGIGHFIWYPREMEGPFEESFPKLVKFYEANGRSVPEWMHGDCPWATRAAFQADVRGARMGELRDLLAGTIRLQSRFLAQRMSEALPKMLDAAPAAQRANVRAQFERLAATGAGTFALIDYVNFKGEGIKATGGQGEVGACYRCSRAWRQRRRRRGSSPSAARMLTRRVENSPRRAEARWLRAGRIGCLRGVTARRESSAQNQTQRMTSSKDQGRTPGPGALLG